MMAMKLAATLFVTTMLAAAPVLAQPTTTQPGTAPGTSSAPTESTPAPATSAPTTSTHRGTAHGDRSAAIPPGQTMEVLVDRRIAQLHRQLQITPAEDPQWDQFTQVMRNNAKELDQAFKDRSDKLDSMSAVDNMLSYSRIELLRAQQAQKLVPAFQTLYASLSDEQKQRADALFRNQSVRDETHQRAAATKRTSK
jgi:periplasmic protein CpxP/Spy